MALLYTQEQREFIRMVQEFADQTLIPEVVSKYDHLGQCPVELFKPAFDMGLHMLEIPEEYGGAGLPYSTTAMVFSKLAEYDAGYAITLVSTFVALRSVMLAGSADQARRFADIIEPGAFAAFALSESDAGTDAGSVKSTATRDGNDYILTGEKTFITNGSIANVYVGIFRTADTGNKGLSAFMIERSREGISVGAHEDKMGLRLSDTSTVNFDHVRVPASNRLGDEGAGFKVAMNSLNLSRAFVATLAAGIMQRALDESVSYARIRSQFKRPIIRFEAVQEMLADMAIALETSQVLIHNTMTMMDQGNLVRKEGAMTKTYVTDALQRVVTDAVQVFGGYGVSKAYPVEKLMRDSKVFQIFEGTNQIQRVTIANELDKEYAGKEVGR